MEPITIGLLIGAGFSAILNIFQFFENASLKEQIESLVSINKELEKQIGSLDKQLRAQKIWHFRIKSKLKKEIRNLYEWVDYIEDAVKREDIGQINEIYKTFSEN